MLLATLLLTLTAQTAWAAGDIYVGYLDPTAPIGQQRKTVLNPVWVDDNTTEMGTAGETTWYLVSGTITKNTRIEVKGTVNLILTDGCNFTVSEGIHVPSGSALNIYAQSVANRGSLTADNGALTYYAAIGGNGGEDQEGYATSGENAGDITIYGGTITTTNGNIGGGDGGKGYAWEQVSGDDESPESNLVAGNGGDGGNGNVTIYSSNVRVNGNIGGGKAGTGEDEYRNDNEYYFGNNGGGNVNLSWANTSDRIYADNYYGTVTLQKAFYNIEETYIIDAGVVNNNDLLNGKNLIYAGDSYTVTIGSMPDGVTATADLELSAGGKTAVVGQVVTISFSGVPDGKVPVVSVTYGDNNYNVNDIIDNGDGTFSFVMPNGNATVTASDGTPEEEVLSLTDNEAYTQQSQIDGVDVSYTRNFSTNWEAIYLPFSLKYEDWKDDFEVARINAVHQYDTNDDGDIDKTELEFVKMTDDESVIEPNTPYLIKAKTSGEKTLSVENTTVYKADVNQIECSTTTEKFIFTGNYETIPYETLIAKKYYAMGGGELVMSNDSDLGPYRWYMERESRNTVYGINNNSANAKEISINVVGEETTGIADIQHPSPDTPTYDLNGRRVNENNLKPGIYVKNGKKFVVK